MEKILNHKKLEKIKKHLEKFVMFLYKKYGITPDILTYIRIFSAPWIALLITKIISGESKILTIITVLLYLIIIFTDFLDGILARAISKEEKHDHFQGGMIDRLGDKILIILLLIPFGINLFTFLIILAESLLAFQAIHGIAEKKQAGNYGKIKMLFQAFLIPILLLQISFSFLPEMFVYTYIIITIVFSYISVYSHYFYFENE